MALLSARRPLVLSWYGKTAMALFPTHAGTSLVLGASFGAAAHIGYGMPLSSCLLAGGLCTITGVLPDVDSDNAVIFRELLTFTAAVTPMLLLDHFRGMGWDQESIVVASGLLYVIIRFGIGEIIRRTTVHRGMWHSVPAAAIVSGIVFMLCACPELNIRLFKTAAAALGYLWHLTLDEIYAVETGMLKVRKKKSFGTAFKFIGKDAAGNLMVYVLLAAVAATIFIFPPSSRIAHGHDHSDPHTQLTPVPGTNGHTNPAYTQPQTTYPYSVAPHHTPAQPPTSPPTYYPPTAPAQTPTSQPWHWNR